MKRNNNTNRILGRYRRPVAHLRFRSRCAVENGAPAMRATTQGEEAPATAPSSCAGRRGIASVAALVAWGRIGQRPRGVLISATLRVMVRSPYTILRVLPGVPTADPARTRGLR
jgi:hypothetical protein